MAFQGNLQGVNAPSNEPGLLGFLSSLVGGFQQGKAQQEESKEKKQEFQTNQAKEKQEMTGNALAQQIQQQQIQTNQATMAATQASAAKQRADQVLQTVWADPTGKRGQDPAIQNMIVQSMQAQGLPVPRKADGSIDYDALKPSVGDMFKDPKAISAFMQQPSDVRKSIAAQYSNFPKELTTAAQQSDVRGEASLIRATAYAKNLPKATDVASKREQAYSRYVDYNGNMDNAHAILYAADAKKASAEAGVVQQKADALSQRAAAYTQSVQKAAARYTSGDRGAASIVLRSADSQLRDYTSQIDSLQGQWAKLASDPTIDADDPRIQSIAAQIGAAQKAQEAAQEEVTNLRATIQSGTGTAKYLSGASGTNATPVQKSNTGGKTVYSTSGGKPIVSNDGGKTWSYYNQ